MNETNPTMLIFDRAMLEEREYWLQRLSGEFELSNLRLDYRRPRTYGGEADVVEINLAGGVAQKLTKLTNHSSFLLYTALLTALKILLHKYTGAKTIVVGSPALKAGDGSSPDTNALAIVTDVDDRVSFRQLLLTVRKSLLEAYAQQRYPFDALIRDLELQTIENKCPLFDVALVLTDLHSAMPAVKNDITLTFTNGPDQITGMISFNKALFKPESIERFRNHFLNGLCAALENENALIAELFLLSDAERHQLLVEWNNTRTAYPKAACIHHLFEAQVERAADAVAVVFENQQLTYRELNRRANQVAHHLRALGVRPEVLVGIYMDRSPEMVVGLLGVLKAGGAYVPLDPAYPHERLAFILEDAQPSVLLTEPRWLKGLPEHKTLKICLDSDWQTMAGQSAENPVSRTTAENLAYVIYTSGSTGQPKGVAIPQAGLVNLVTWHQRVYHVRPADRATQLSGPAFDAAVWELWPYLLAGASIHMPDEETRLSLVKLWDWLAVRAITFCFLPTPLAEALLDEPWPTGLVLKALLTGGDQLHRGPRPAQPFDLVNHYGPTENTVVTTWAAVAAAAETEDPPPIGRPIDNTQVYLLDAGRQPVPIGVAGELHIGGDSLARGYLNRPELTAEKFIPHPFSDEPGARLYPSGDWARYRPDGRIDFLGRIDQQVKIRGYRIELGEIETVLGRHPAMRETLVVAREDIPGDRRLVAYFVPAQKPAPAIDELRRFLQEKLPEPMVPSAFVMLEALPLTPNGKVDRRALPAPDRTRPGLENAFVAPRTSLEEVIARIWTQILGVDPVGIHDNFFELGGHSLSATQLISHLKKSFQVDVPLSAVFATPTIAELGETVEELLVAQVEKLSKEEAQSILSTEPSAAEVRN